jgi:hypothetical protein
MDTTSQRLSVIGIRVALVGTLAAFALYVVASASPAGPGARRHDTRRDSRPWRAGSRQCGARRKAAASAVGLVGAVLYLRSLADEPSAIPLVGVVVLVVSLVGLVVSPVMVRTSPRAG